MQDSGKTGWREEILMANGSNDKKSNQKAHKKTNKPKRKKGIRKQRWAAIIAGVVAAAFILSIPLTYGLHYLMGDNTEPGQELTADDYLAHFQREVDNLENAIQELGPGKEMLEQLAENYNNLIMIRQIFFDDPDKVEADRYKLAAVYEELVELEPGEPHYRMELAQLYSTLDETDDRALEEAAVLSGLLRDEPDVHLALSLVSFYDSKGLDDLMQEEAIWLKGYLEEELSAEDASYHYRYQYAVLMGDFLHDKDEALAQLELILEEIDEENELYDRVVDFMDELLEEDADESVDEDQDDDTDPNGSDG